MERDESGRTCQNAECIRKGCRHQLKLLSINGRHREKQNEETQQQVHQYAMHLMHLSMKYIVYHPYQKSPLKICRIFFFIDLPHSINIRCLVYICISNISISFFIVALYFSKVIKTADHDTQSIIITRYSVHPLI